MREKKQLISLIAAVSVFILMIVAYFVINAVLTDDAVTEEPPRLVEGEVLGPNNRIVIFEQLSRDRIKSVKVHNEYGEYSFVRDGDSFVIDGYDHLTYSNELFSSLVVASGYSIASSRVTDSASDEDVARYGLDEPVASWTVTSTDGVTHTVKVGDKLVSGGGYYAQLEEREDCIYVISTTVENSILKPLEAYVTPVLCVGMTQNDYYTADNFTVMHGEDVFVSIKQCEKDEYVNPDAMAETKLIYPAGYKTDDTFFMSNVLAPFVSMQGEETVYIGEDEEELAKYGLDTPYYSVYFTFGSGKAEVEYYFFVSTLQEDGYYYAVSNLYGFKVVVRCNSDTFGWLERDLISWVDDFPIAINILLVDSITIDTGDAVHNFALKHGVDAEENVTLEVDGDDGFHLSNDDVYNFRELYKDFLAVQIMGDIDVTKSELAEIKKDDGSFMATITFNMRDGGVNEYTFHRYSTRRAALSVGGNESFYVITDWIDKIESDVTKLLNNLEIDSHAKN